MFSGGVAGLVIGVVLGALGLGYIAYAKRTAELPVLACGLVLLIFPLFVGSVWALLAVGALVALLPWAGAHFGWW